jgi:hypothetical protein
MDMHIISQYLTREENWSKEVFYFAILLRFALTHIQDLIGAFIVELVIHFHKSS